MAPWGLSQETLRAELSEYQTELLQQMKEQAHDQKRTLQDELSSFKNMLLNDFVNQVLHPELKVLSGHLERVVQDEVALLQKSLGKKSKAARSVDDTAPGSARGSVRTMTRAETPNSGRGNKELAWSSASSGHHECFMARVFSGEPDAYEYSTLSNEDGEGKPEIERVHESHVEARRTKIKRQSMIAVVVAEDEDEGAPVNWQTTLQGNSFHTFVRLLVILNLICQGWETDNGAKHLSQKPVLFQNINLTFLFMFILELLLRIVVYGFTVFDQLDANLTMVDIIAIGLQIVNTYDPRIFGDYGINFLCLRVFRLSRALHSMHVTSDNSVGSVISELRMIVTTLVGSLRSLLWVAGFLVLLTYAFSTYIMKLLQHHLRLHPERAHSKELDHLLSMYGSMGESMLTLYQVLTGGLEWRHACEPLMKYLREDSVGIAIGFVVYTAFALFVLLNVITGLFLSGAEEAAREDKIRTYRDEMQQTFIAADGDGSGDVSWHELESQLQSARFKNILRSLGLHEAHVFDLFHILDDDKSGSVSSDEFVEGCVRLSGAVKAIDFAIFTMRFEEVSETMSMELSRCHDLLYDIRNRMNEDGL
eukprot:TRINITY_DN21379_c0_g1_i2.p1 TRINITY_DN21379_c0_g1~~TRINITY_DN21379_c0_g1_i2.p1  ORF type:complete len:592 (-),score=90.99 TRINITY_DN21379_c0_g1_i2:8-1783(-)